MSTLCEWLVAGWFDPIHSRRVRLISTESPLNNDCFWWIICFIFETSQQKQREFCFFCVWLVILFDRVRKPRRGVVMEAMDPKWSTWGKASKARGPNRGSRSDGAEEERTKKNCATLNRLRGFAFFEPILCFFHIILPRLSFNASRNFILS